MSEWMIALGGFGSVLLYVVFRWLTRKSAIDAASVFLRSRNRQYRDSDDY